MKKIIVLFLFMINLITLAGCDPSSYYYSYEDLNSNVTSIELINYVNNDSVELFGKKDKVKNFDFSKLNVKEVLDNDKNSEFLLEFSKIEFMLVWRHLDSPKGESIKINYRDGSFDVVCYYVQFSCQYDKSGNVKNFIGSGGGNHLKELVEEVFYKKL